MHVFAGFGHAPVRYHVPGAIQSAGSRCPWSEVDKRDSPVFRLHGGRGVVAAIRSVELDVESQGRGRDHLHSHTMAGAVTVGAFLLGWRCGPLGIILALAFTSLAIRLPIVYYLVGRRGPVATSDLWIGFWPTCPDGEPLI